MGGMAPASRTAFRASSPWTATFMRAPAASPTPRLSAAHNFATPPAERTTSAFGGNKQRRSSAEAARLAVEGTALPA
eukprot:scaffold156039_cov24-Tisochrysis_lutea.AAC.3